MKIDRMALADLGSPETLVQGIIMQVPEIPIPVPIEDIAKAVDISDIAAIGASGFEGGLITDREKSQGVILVNRENHRRRQRFTIGHELGHFLMPLHLPDEGEKFMCTSADMRKSDMSNTIDRVTRMEIEANRFAANMLMPISLFRRDLSRSAVPDLDVLVRLARKYDTSKEAAARRFCDLVDKPSAAVFSKDGKFIYAVRGDGFPFIPLRKGLTLPSGSLTTRFSGKEGDVSDMDTVDGHWWVDAAPYCNRPLLEQTLVQANGFCLTLLQLDEDDIEEADEEDDLIESYAVRFRKR